MARIADGGERGFEGGGIASADVERRAEGDDLFDTGQAADFFGQVEEVGTGDGPGREAHTPEHVVERAVGQEFSVGEVGEAVAALGFIHVVRRDEHGETLGGEAVNLIPKFAAGLGVDSGGGFVEEEELR